MRCPISAIAKVLTLTCLTVTVNGCVTPAAPVTTVWQKLGIPQTGARIRDSALNRRGNFPGFEKKPPLLKLSDPANLAPDKPAMIQTAAKIKAEQDMKKQKIKAIKFLADVNCGCYNKDKAVEKAFLAALDDCDPDVRKAAVEGLDKTISSCAPCRANCETTCCTEDLYKKLNDIAYGVTEGCFKEPVQEIRVAAAAVTKKCGCFKPNPIEELPAPEAIETEELRAPDEAPGPINPEDIGTDPSKAKPNAEDSQDSDKNAKTGRFRRGRAEEVGTATTRNFHLSDSDESYDLSFADNPKVIVADTTQFRMSDNGELRKVSVETPKSPKLSAKSPSAPRALKPNSESNATSLADAKSAERITNPERLVTAKVVEYRGALGELLVELPDSFQLNAGWTMVVIDGQGEQSFARITECGGRRLLLALDDVASLSLARNKPLKLGLVQTN